MTWILKNYRIVLIVISIILFVLLIRLVIARQNANKIPSRGVFVMRSTWDKSCSRLF